MIEMTDTCNYFRCDRDATHEEGGLPFCELHYDQKVKIEHNQKK
jgi:hypothetical protein